jgi:cell cycle arrest protein BUB3
VAALDFNHNGSLLAVASSYTFEQGDIDHAPDQIFVRHITETDVKPKARK